MGLPDGVAEALERGPVRRGDEDQPARPLAVEIRSFAAHQPITSFVKVLTQTPEGPLAMNGFASSSHAVPAMSRCTQGVSPTNSRRNQAAVIEPPARPPMLARSAKALLSNSL